MDDINLVLDLLLLSKLSYKNQEEINKFWNDKNDNKLKNLYDLCQNVPKFYQGADGNDCQAYTVTYDKKLIIIFRGTESFRDVIADLNISLSPLHLNMIRINHPELEHPMVHKGFNNQYNSIKDKLLCDIENYIINHEFPEIIVTGHSLGSGIATIAAFHYCYQYNFPIKCVTFGSPRVGNQLFVDLFNKRIHTSIRYVNEDDPVTMVPLPIRFRHVNNCRWLHKNNVENDTDKYRWFRFFKNLLCCFCFASVPWQDHSCTNYYDDITNYY